MWTEHTVQVAALQQPGAAAAIKAAHGAHLDDRWPILAHMTPVGMQPNEEETLFTRVSPHVLPPVNNCIQRDLVSVFFLFLNLILTFFFSSFFFFLFFLSVPP